MKKFQLLIAAALFIDVCFLYLGARESIEAACRCMFGVEVTQISVLYFISYMSAADSLKSLIEATENTAQEYKIVVRSNRHEHKRKGGGGWGKGEL